MTPHTAILYIAALPIIWTTHYTGEALSTTIHEMGHAITKKIQDGDPIDITVEHSTEAKKNIGAFICTPFHGYAEYKTPGSSRTKKIATTIAGPLAGLAATYAQLTALELIDQKLKKEKLSIKKALKNGLTQPFGLLKDIATIDKIKRPHSTSSFIIQGIKFFRCSRLIGETLYGLTPFEIPNIHGDGISAWKEIRQKNNIKTIGKKPKDLILYTAAPFITAAIIGSARTAIKKAAIKK